MPRKKKAAPDAAPIQSSAAAAVAETETHSEPGRPDCIDGPPVTPEGKVVTPANPDAKNWGEPQARAYHPKAFHACNLAGM